jgi:CDP-diacylglycerol--glycerol-3-phosphate 3-phosphatidyltransferase
VTMDSSGAGTVDGGRVALRQRIPNALTVGRLLVLPFFWVLLARAAGGYSVAAGILFATASITDYLDGYLARRFGSSTRFGRLADPLADRLLIDSAVLLLWWHGRIALVALLLIVGRDLALLAGFKLAASRGYELSVIYLGKTATSVLMVGLGLIMITRPDQHWPVYVFDAGLALALLAGGAYLATVRGRLRAKRGAA